MTVNFPGSNLENPSLFPASERRQRILALVFPHLSTDRIARRLWGMSWRSTGRPDHPPMVCAGRHGNAMRLTGLDEAAEALGLKRGQGLAEARAMFPMLDVMDEDAAADAAVLSALADWCDRYTPLVALDGRDGLFLDITGCAHLFGGEEKLLDDILSRLRHLGFDVRGAISSSPGLSWAVSRFSKSRVIADHADKADLAIRQALAHLSVRALRLDDGLVAGLNKLGLKQVGDLLRLDRAPLARRFGAGLLLRLDQRSVTCRRRSRRAARWRFCRPSASLPSLSSSKRIFSALPSGWR